MAPNPILIIKEGPYIRIPSPVSSVPAVRGKLVYPDIVSRFDFNPSHMKVSFRILRVCCNSVATRKYTDQHAASPGIRFGSSPPHGSTMRHVSLTD